MNDLFPSSMPPTGAAIAAQLEALGLGRLQAQTIAQQILAGHGRDPNAHAGIIVSREQLEQLAANAARCALAGHSRDPSAHRQPSASFDAAPILAAAYFQ